MKPLEQALWDAGIFDDKEADIIRDLFEEEYAKGLVEGSRLTHVYKVIVSKV